MRKRNAPACLSGCLLRRASVGTCHHSQSTLTQISISYQTMTNATSLQLTLVTICRPFLFYFQGRTIKLKYKKKRSKSPTPHHTSAPHHHNRCNVTEVNKSNFKAMSFYSAAMDPTWRVFLRRRTASCWYKTNTTTSNQNLNMYLKILCFGLPKVYIFIFII